MNKFPLGQVLATPGALDAFTQAGDFRFHRINFGFFLSYFGCFFGHGVLVLHPCLHFLGGSWSDAWWLPQFKPFLI